MPEKSYKLLAPIIIILLIFFLVINSLFTVQAGENALLLRLGKIVTDGSGKAKIYPPGLHIKTPFITSVRKLDVKIQNLDAESPRILTQEQKYLYVDYYAKWRITDVPLYYTRTGGNVENTQNLLTQKINDSIRSEFGRKTLQDVISDDRLKIMASLQQSANKNAKELGIQLIDVRIKSIDLLQQVLESVYQRMSTKREQVATEYRADGEAQAEKIRSTADAQAQKMIAEARRQAAIKRGEGDREAANIYIQAYSQDPEFYSFYRSLQAYRHAFSNRNTILLLKPDSDFFKYFNNALTVTPPVKSKS